MYYFLPIGYEIIKLYKHKFDLHKGDLVFVEGKPMLMRIFLICYPDYPRINT